MLTLPRATFTYPLLLNPLHTTHPSFQSCDTDGSITSSSSSWYSDYSDEDWYVQELHAHQTPRYPFATPALPPPSPLRYKLSFTAIGDEYSCSLYAASADTAEAYGEPLLTTTHTDSTDDAVTTSGAPELWMSSTTKAAKFTFQNMDSDSDTAKPTPKPTPKPTTEPTIVEIDFCDSDEYDELDDIQGTFTYDNTFEGVSCVAENEDDDDEFAIADDLNYDFTVGRSVSKLRCQSEPG